MNWLRLALRHATCQVLLAVGFAGYLVAALMCHWGALAIGLGAGDVVMNTALAVFFTRRAIERERRRNYGGYFVPPLWLQSQYIPGLSPHTRRIGPPLPRRQQADPFVGFKTMRVVSEGDRLRFQGSTGSTYDLTAVASCPRDGGHESPGDGCSCGFYALASKPKNWEYGAFMASVEMYGKVIVGRHGWRAQKQRILKIEARPNCGTCGAEATGFSIGSDVTPVCGEHADDSFVTLAELTGKIGTEVSWDEPLDPNDPETSLYLALQQSHAQAMASLAAAQTQLGITVAQAAAQMQQAQAHLSVIQQSNAQAIANHVGWTLRSHHGKA